MGYLKEFQTNIQNRDFAKFMVLWEEYCTNDSAPALEVIELLHMVKKSDLARPFGKYVETLIPLWKTFQDPKDSYEVLKLIIDLQTTQTKEMGDLSQEMAEKRYGSHPKFSEWLRLSGIRSRENFQGALSSIELLAHLEQGNFIFHQGGWGVGEIVEMSPVREQLVIEFENVSGKKNISFANAMKILTPVPKTHFLARRFSHADELEKDAKENPVEVLKMLLRDLGPKTAAEIKDEMCELVIPEDEWSKWWQAARQKLKKDLTVEAPDQLKEPFKMRTEETSHAEEFKKSVGKKKGVDEILLVCYSFMKEQPSQFKNADFRASFLTVLGDLLKKPNLSQAQLIQIALFYQNLEEKGPSFDQVMSEVTDYERLIQEIGPIAAKKQALQWIQGKNPEWPDFFIKIFSSTSESFLREYILKELSQSPEYQKKLQKKIEDLLHNPNSDPELYYWLFQKAIGTDEEIFPLSGKKMHEKWWEGLLILLSRIENLPSYADLTKKIYNILTQNRYALVRQFFKDAGFDFTKEFLLLASKCHSIEDKDQKSLKSLAAVHHPSLGGSGLKSDDQNTQNVIWTTQQGFLKTQERIKHIGTVETVDNAKEIEAARALGDLRENAEYKFAKERRARLQGEMRRLSHEIQRARIITPQDVSHEEVGVGSIVVVQDGKGTDFRYTILGPWDADPEGNVLSLQSKLAQTLVGLKEGDSYQFKDEKFTIKSLKTIFD